MDRQGQSHSIDLLFVLLIFAGFVATAMLLISMETSEYQKIIGRMQDNDLSRVTTAYLTQKVRQGREIDAITTEDFHGIPSLCVRSRIAGRQYETYLYVYEGRLMELMTPEGNIDSVIPAGGTPLVPMEELHFEIIKENAVLVEGITGDGEELSTLLTIAP
ncbi:MAG: DUF4860 domain-containing protein [Stomatobaculum sp.]|nr:DUF4860 domain-containing protein [Stomatobaculum sp.]